MLIDFAMMGIETHIRVTYGDEETFTPPWDLISHTEAQIGPNQWILCFLRKDLLESTLFGSGLFGLGLERAQRAVDLCQQYKTYYFPQNSPGE